MGLEAFCAGVICISSRCGFRDANMGRIWDKESGLARERVGTFYSGTNDLPAETNVSRIVRERAD